MVEKPKAAFPPFRLCLYRQFACVFGFILSLEPTSRLTRSQRPCERCVILHWSIMGWILAPVRDSVEDSSVRSNACTSKLKRLLDHFYEPLAFVLRLAVRTGTDECVRYELCVALVQPAVSWVASCALLCHSDRSLPPNESIYNKTHRAQSHRRAASNAVIIPLWQTQTMKNSRR